MKAIVLAVMVGIFSNLAFAGGTSCSSIFGTPINLEMTQRFHDKFLQPRWRGKGQSSQYSRAIIRAAKAGDQRTIFFVEVGFYGQKHPLEVQRSLYDRTTKGRRVFGFQRQMHNGLKIIESFAGTASDIVHFVSRGDVSDAGFVRAKTLSVPVDRKKVSYLVEEAALAPNFAQRGSIAVLVKTPNEKSAEKLRKIRGLRETSEPISRKNTHLFVLEDSSALQRLLSHEKDYLHIKLDMF